jgi:hypothetical protein
MYSLCILYYFVAYKIFSCYRNKIIQGKHFYMFAKIWSNHNKSFIHILAGKPKVSNAMKSLCLMLGPDFITDIIEVSIIWKYGSVKGLDILKLYVSRWAKIFQENQTWEKCKTILRKVKRFKWYFKCNVQYVENTMFLSDITKFIKQG